MGAFIGGFLFNYVYNIIPNDIVARCIAIIIMGALIGVGVGLLEQFAKQAWLKVIRGEFEGKVFVSQLLLYQTAALMSSFFRACFNLRNLLYLII